jgi:THAP4-like, heme-binding beta-barrel domain
VTGSEPAPIPADTADLRTGVPVHDALLALLPLVGEWQGSGTGVPPAGGAPFRFGQRARFTHDGRPFLAYESRAWLVDDAGQLIRAAWRESGFWRPGAGPDDIEVVLASHTGQALVFAGTAGDNRWEVRTTSASPAATAVRVDGERRLYALVTPVDPTDPMESVDAPVGRASSDLAYASDLAVAGHDFAPHLSARLRRR